MTKIINVISIISLLFCCCPNVFSQYKVVERSDKKRPEWVGQTIPGYLTFSAESDNLELAKQKCMDNIKNEIINAIAVNISSESSMMTEQTKQNDTYSTNEYFRNEFKSRAVQLPFVSGITIANAEDSYWEKLYDKKQKKYHYVFFLKYPFSRMERNRLIAEFQAYDEEKYNQLLSIKKEAEQLNNLDDVRSLTLALNPLINYFFDETRKQEAQSLQEDLRQIHKKVQVNTLSNELGTYHYALLLNGHKATQAKMPNARSEFAQNISVVPNIDTTFTVTYEYEGCLPEDENAIDLLFNFGGTTQRHRFYFDLGENSMEVIPQGTVKINGTYNEENSCLENITVDFGLRSKYDAPFTIETLQFSTNELPNVVIEPQSKQTYGKGLNHIILTINSTRFKQTSKSSLTDGTITIKNQKTKKEESIRFKLPYIINL